MCVGDDAECVRGHERQSRAAPAPSQLLKLLSEFFGVVGGRRGARSRAMSGARVGQAAKRGTGVSKVGILRASLRMWSRRGVYVRSVYLFVLSELIAGALMKRTQSFFATACRADASSPAARRMHLPPAPRLVLCAPLLDTSCTPSKACRAPGTHAKWMTSQCATRWRASQGPWLGLARAIRSIPSVFWGRRPSSSARC